MRPNVGPPTEEIGPTAFLAGQRRRAIGRVHSHGPDVPGARRLRHCSKKPGRAAPVRPEAARNLRSGSPSLVPKLALSELLRWQPRKAGSESGFRQSLRTAIL